VKTKGMGCIPGQLVAFMGTQGHYSFTKGSAFLGIGTDNLVKVACDDAGRIIPSALEEAVVKTKEEGKIPFFIAAVAGTTVLGAYDNLEAIADVRDRHNMYMHVDGAWGGSVLLSEKYKHLVKGLHRADSFTWNPHKQMGVPLQCSAFLTKHSGLLMSAHSSSAKYLFQKDKLNASLDTGDKSVQCGRKVDIMKLWLCWQSLGNEGFRARVDGAIEQAERLRDEIKKRPGVFELVADPVFANVCFWFIPPSQRGKEKNTEEWRAKVHAAPPAIKARAQKTGGFMVGFQSVPLKSDPNPPNFFRMVYAAPSPVPVASFLDHIEALGEDL